MFDTVEVRYWQTHVWGWMRQAARLSAQRVPVFSSVGLYRIAWIRKGRHSASGD